LAEDLFCNRLLVEGGQSDVMSFGDGVKGFQAISIFLGIQTLDQRIENSVADAERFNASVYSGLSRQS
jgi:hypothetical protein